MDMKTYYGSHKLRLVSSVKMLSSLWLIAVSLVVAENDTPLYSQSTLPPQTSDFAFEDGEGAVNVTARVGCNVYLDCSLPMLQGYHVIWLYRNAESISLLTVNKLAYTNDRRITLNFRDPNNFRLSIANVSRSDEGLYECQVLTSPKKVKQVFLKTVESDTVLYSKTASESPSVILPTQSTIEPYFEYYSDGPTKVTVNIGYLLHILCCTSILHGYHVSWVYRRPNSDYPDVLTFDNFTVSSDSNITMSIPRPNCFVLSFHYIRRRHEGIYECQLSTTPRKFLQYFVKVDVPRVTIIHDINYESVTERFYVAGNAVELTCVASHLDIPGENITWWRDGVFVPDGISYNPNVEPGFIESNLVLHHPQPHDSGNYTCNVNNLASASVYVHIVSSTNSSTNGRICQINEYSQVE